MPSRQRNTRIAPYTSPYPVRHLKIREARVVHLLPGNFDETIVLRLQRVELSSALKYEALSYVWGTSLSPLQARVNGLGMWITENLDCALRHLRFRTGIRTIWIDALCINQRNLAERNQQVRMMGSIYAMAHRVVIWLGPENAHDPIENVIARGQLTPENDIRWITTLCRLTERPWFTRVWVAQEFALSHNEPIVRIGHKSMSWGSFKQRFVAATIVQMRNDAPHDVESAIEESSNRIDLIEDTKATLSGTRILKRLRMATGTSKTNGDDSGTIGAPSTENTGTLQSSTNSAHFAFQLIRTALLVATDPRDKVYGLLGMSDFQHQRVEADYSKPVEQVFTEAAANLLHERHVEFYMHFPLRGPRRSSAEEQHVVLDLPSWVPDLTLACPSGNTIHLDLPANDITLVRQAYHRPNTLISPPTTTNSDLYIHQLCAKPPSSNYPIKVSPSASTLTTYGRSLGKITQVLSTSSDDLIWADSLSSGPRTISTFYKSFLIPKNISAKTFLLALLLVPMRNPDVDPDILEPFATLLEAGTSLTPRTSALDIPKDFLKDFGQLIHLATAERTVFVTNNGKVGVTYHTDPEGVRAGDEVVGLFGIGFPFVLRRNAEECGNFTMINVAHIAEYKWGYDGMGTGDDAQRWGLREYIIK